MPLQHNISAKEVRTMRLILVGSVMFALLTSPLMVSAQDIDLRGVHFGKCEDLRIHLLQLLLDEPLPDQEFEVDYFENDEERHRTFTNFHLTKIVDCMHVIDYNSGARHDELMRLLAKVAKSVGRLQEKIDDLEEQIMRLQRTTR